ncbi:hypothetical protein, partial [Halovivax sp.]|uniref:hypothetical protein n=1 Tax=Halovivax sp. TaxID=1935978 RepID=UPI0025BFE5B2
MSALSPRAEHRPTQYYYDSSSGRVDVIVDVSPAAREDLTVLVGDSRIELRIEDAEGTDERSFRTPTATWRFDDEHRAVYNNGV